MPHKPASGIIRTIYHASHMSGHLWAAVPRSLYPTVIITHRGRTRTHARVGRCSWSRVSLFEARHLAVGDVIELHLS
jgi:hypothetical protein